MQPSIVLANEILSILETADSRDAISALKIAMILLPVKIPSRTPYATVQVLEESALEV
jgi:hypothetical protein